MAEADPEISVVIPTRLRETRLAFALDSLAEQGLPRELFEVIVVRAPDGIDVPLTSAPEGFEVRFLVAESAGAATQRNVGWRAARSDFIAFVDDDCRPAPMWLTELLAARQGPVHIVQGRTEPDPEEIHLLHGFARSMDVTKLDAWYPTCNLAYPKQLLESLDGFDESYLRAWGEDTDLGLRAMEQGASISYEPSALVYHAVHARPLSKALRDATQRNTLPAVLARHPAQRSALYLGLFTRVSHARLLLAIAGTIAFHRRPLLALIAALPYLESNFDRTRMTPWGLFRFLLHLPARAAVDSTETASLIVSSARERTPML